jgi:hypothetical protein
VQSNPITHRVAKLSNQWLEFASNRRARLLCWRLASDEQRMLEGFFALELDERTAENGRSSVGSTAAVTVRLGWEGLEYAEPARV